MHEFKTPEDLREFLLNFPRDFDDECYDKSGSCYSISLKNDNIIIRVNTKKIGTISLSDIPNNVKSDPKFMLTVSTALRKCNGSVAEVVGLLNSL